jgi:hypothetical protein
MSDETVVNLDEMEWAIPSYNKRGQSTRVQIKLPPEYESAYRVLIERGGFPYLTMEDAFRHAIYRHLSWLNAIRELRPATAYTAALTVCHLMKDEMLKSQIEEAIDPFCKRLREYLDNGYVEAASVLLTRVLAAIQEVPQGPQRDQLEKAMTANAGRIQTEVENRRALMLAKQMEMQADAAAKGEEVPEFPTADGDGDGAVAGVVDTVRGSEDDATVYGEAELVAIEEMEVALSRPSIPAPTIDLLSSILYQEMGAVARTFNGPDIDDLCLYDDGPSPSPSLGWGGDEDGDGDGDSDGITPWNLNGRTTY